jgi:hypothetical protein
MRVIALVSRGLFLANVKVECQQIMSCSLHCQSLQRPIFRRTLVHISGIDMRFYNPGHRIQGQRSVEQGEYKVGSSPERGWYSARDLFFASLL